MKQIISLACRVFFIVAFLMGVLAVWEKLANFLHLTILRGSIHPSRLLELAAIALLFVIALQLRELKFSLEEKRG